MSQKNEGLNQDKDFWRVIDKILAHHFYRTRESLPYQTTSYSRKSINSARNRDPFPYRSRRRIDPSTIYFLINTHRKNVQTILSGSLALSNLLQCKLLNKVKSFQQLNMAKFNVYDANLPQT